jgi:hypothetical protein
LAFEQLNSREARPGREECSCGGPCCVPACMGMGRHSWTDDEREAQAGNLTCRLVVGQEPPADPTSPRARLTSVGLKERVAQVAAHIQAIYTVIPGHFFLPFASFRGPWLEVSFSFFFFFHFSFLCFVLSFVFIFLFLLFPLCVFYFIYFSFSFCTWHFVIFVIFYFLSFHLLFLFNFSFLFFYLFFLSFIFSFLFFGGLLLFFLF